MCAEYVNVQNVIMFNMDEQLTNFQDIIVNQQVMIDMKNKDFANLAVDFIKEKKKIKRWQQTALTFMGVSLALLIVVLIK